ncbi:hypothetical protein EV424DRAFT_1346273 [Suillus variegatus]|nr:hypothetical protein EV424DRAFT_1346273 [Suillus variegatus]
MSLAPALLSIGFNHWIRKLRFMQFRALGFDCRVELQLGLLVSSVPLLLTGYRNILSCTPPDTCLPACHGPECHMYLTSPSKAILIQTFGCIRRRKIPDCIGIKFLECFYLHFPMTPGDERGAVGHHRGVVFVRQTDLSGILHVFTVTRSVFMVAVCLPNLRSTFCILTPDWRHSLRERWGRSGNGTELDLQSVVYNIPSHKSHQNFLGDCF